jgi:putative FmdB family regulatory protein
VPTYQYACTACGHRFEAVQSFSDSSLTDCPECAGRLRKVFSSVGIVFKGSGFYRTDSRTGGSGTDSGKDSGKEKVAAGTSSDSGDSKGSSGSDSSTKKADSSPTSAPSSTSSAPAAAASA